MVTSQINYLHPFFLFSPHPSCRFLVLRAYSCELESRDSHLALFFTWCFYPGEATSSLTGSISFFIRYEDLCDMFLSQISVLQICSLKGTSEEDGAQQMEINGRISCIKEHGVRSNIFIWRPSCYPKISASDWLSTLWLLLSWVRVIHKGVTG